MAQEKMDKTAQIIDGKAIAADLREDIAKEVSQMDKPPGISRLCEKQDQGLRKGGDQKL